MSWVVVGGSAAWVAMFALPTYDLPLVVAFQAVPFAPAIAVAPALLFASVTQRWALALASSAVLGCSVIAVLSGVAFSQPIETSRVTSTVKVTSSNILVNNGDLRTAATEVMSTGADVVVVQEVEAVSLTVIDNAARENSYPFRAADPHPGFHGGAIYSRYPLGEWRVVDVAGSPMLVAEVLTPTGRVTVVNVHTVAPLTSRLAAQWRRQFDALEALSSESQTPVLLIGDFNATVDHEPFVKLLERGYRDAFEEVGNGWGNTFPSNYGPVPPFMRIDHAIASSSIQFHSIDDWRVEGSDHRAITVVISLSSEELAP